MQDENSARTFDITVSQHYQQILQQKSGFHSHNSLHTKTDSKGSLFFLAIVSK